MTQHDGRKWRNNDYNIPDTQRFAVLLTSKLASEMTFPFMSPPELLDGAIVKQFAWIGDLTSMAIVNVSLNGNPIPKPEAIAICQYPEEEAAYVFHCSSQWLVLGAGHCISLQQAIESAERGYPGISTCWVNCV